MADLLKELIEFAEEVRTTIPSTTTGADAIKWMQKARYFTDECIVEGRLKGNLEPFIPLKRRGDFVQAAESVKAVGGQFQGQVEEVKRLTNNVPVTWQMRLVLIAAMAGFLTMAMAIPEVFGAGALTFELSYL